MLLDGLDKETYISNIETKSVTTDGLEDIVKVRTFEETQVDSLDMRELRHQLDFDPHDTAEGHVLDQDRKIFSNNTFANANGKNYFGIDFAFELASGQV